MYRRLLRDMNAFIRSSAAIMVMALFFTSHLFERFPEFILGFFCLFFLPQIIQNTYTGVR